MPDNKDTIDARLKQLQFRSRHRGINEMDQIMGRFAAGHLATLDNALLDQYERLLNLPDLDVYPWLVEQAEPPAEWAALIALIRKSIAA